MNTSDSAALALAREQQLMNPESFARAMALADQINAAQQVAVQQAAAQQQAQAAALQPVNRTAAVANPYYNARGAVEDYRATGLLPPIYQRDPYGTATYMVGPGGSVAHLAAFPSRSPHVLFGDPRPLGSGAWVSALATLMNAARHPATQLLRMPTQQAPARSAGVGGTRRQAAPATTDKPGTTAVNEAAADTPLDLRGRNTVDTQWYGPDDMFSPEYMSRGRWAMFTTPRIIKGVHPDKGGPTGSYAGPTPDVPALTPDEAVYLAKNDPTFAQEMLNAEIAALSERPVANEMALRAARDNAIMSGSTANPMNIIDPANMSREQASLLSRALGF